MSFLVSRSISATLLLLACLLCGCLDPGQNPLDEEKEPQFIEGKNRVRDLDYKGAIESYQKTLETNPRHAEANFELGWLFDQKEADPAAAIYHYDRYLRLRPNADKQETVKNRILACKQELARTVSLGPVTQTMQREFENLSEENKRLREELEKWRTFATQLQTWSNQLAAQASAAQTQAAQAQAARTVPLPLSRTGEVRHYQAPGSPPVNPTLPPGRIITPLPPPRPAVPITPTYRTHTVKSGETPTVIARRYGVKVDALMSANPRLDPRRMKVGQTLKIPNP